MLSHNSSHIQFITYTQFQSQFHDPNIITYHANLIQNTNKLHKNASHNTRNKTPQTISHNQGFPTQAPTTKLALTIETKVLTTY